MLSLFTLFVVAIAATQAQQQGGTTLHGICHSNHLAQTEDQVIEQLVTDMDLNGNGTIQRAELLLFFARLLGVNLEGDISALLALSHDELLQLAAGLKITRHDFVQAWHAQYHDNVEFVQATFDALEALNGDTDGALDAVEIEAIVNHALHNFDANGDDALQKAEMVAYLEHIYKNCPEK